MARTYTSRKGWKLTVVPKAPRVHDALLAQIEAHNLDHGGSAPVPDSIAWGLRAAGITVPRRLTGREAHTRVMQHEGEPVDEVEGHAA